MNSSLAVAEQSPAPAQPAAAAAARHIAAAIAGIVRLIVLAQARRRTMRVLHGLDDASLKDIGLSRSEIGGVDRHDRYLRPFTRF